jgi:hypothetical protein
MDSAAITDSAPRNAHRVSRRAPGILAVGVAIAGGVVWGVAMRYD